MPSPENEPRRPAVGDQGAARDEIGEQTADAENAATTTSDGERILAVVAWVNGTQLAHWCCRCENWHGNNFDPDESASILRRAPLCWRDTADVIRLEVRGQADADLQARIRRGDPPPGIPDPGRRLNADTVKPLFLAQVRWIARLIKRNASAVRVAEAVHYGQAFTLVWHRLSRHGTRQVRRRDLVAEVSSAWKTCTRVRDAVANAKVCPPTPEDGDLGDMTPRRLRDLIAAWTSGMIRTIESPTCADYEGWAWAFGHIGILIESWRRLAGPAGRRAGPEFWSLVDAAGPLAFGVSANDLVEGSMR